MSLTKHDYFILIAIGKCNAFEKNSAITLIDLQKKLEESEKKVSIHKIRSSIHLFKILGFVKEGSKTGDKGNTKTYYITKEGVNEIQSNYAKG